jgi:Family of unknown function (DUF6494)
MKDEALNMSIRKYLKTVGVNSQIAIEKAVHRALAEQTLKGNEMLPVTMTLSVGKIDLKLSFDGELNLE